MGNSRAVTALFVTACHFGVNNGPVSTNNKTLAGKLTFGMEFNYDCFIRAKVRFLGDPDREDVLQLQWLASIGNRTPLDKIFSASSLP